MKLKLTKTKKGYFFEVLLENNSSRKGATLMNELKIFENEEFGEIRTIIKDNEPWFVGKDIADILGYSNTRDALLKHVFVLFR